MRVGPARVDRARHPAAVGTLLEPQHAVTVRHRRQDVVAAVVVDVDDVHERVFGGARRPSACRRQWHEDDAAVWRHRRPVAQVELSRTGRRLDQESFLDRLFTGQPAHLALSRRRGGISGLQQRHAAPRGRVQDPLARRADVRRRFEPAPRRDDVVAFVAVDVTHADPMAVALTADGVLLPLAVDQLVPGQRRLRRAGELGQDLERASRRY